MELTPEEFERRLETLGLGAERIPLKTRPGVIHWHIRKVGQPGTLEATWDQGTVSLIVRRNRQGQWTSEAVEALTNAN